ncbi:MAG: hypothetical protein ACRDPQ_13100 [Nocardioidaceae bacterium]
MRRSIWAGDGVGAVGAPGIAPRMDPPWRRDDLSSEQREFFGRGALEATLVVRSRAAHLGALIDHWDEMLTTLRDAGEAAR